MFPTRHWRLLSGNIVAGGQATLVHGLLDGRNLTSIIPDVVVPFMPSAQTWANANASIQLAPNGGLDATNVYLTNWDSASAHNYAILIRSFYSDDDTNQ